MGTRIEITGGAAYATFEGELTTASWNEAFRELVSHPDFAPSLPTLWDFRRATGVGRLTAADFEAMSQPVRDARGDLSPRAPVAMVTGTDLDFGMARMYEMVTEDSLPIRIRVFREIDAAAKWIKLPPG